MKFDVDKLADLLKKQCPQICFAFLHGSAARGQLDEGSDIDLLIVLPEVNWEIEKQIVDVCFDAELEVGRVFSTICYTIDELEHSPLRVSPLVLNARKEGVPL